MGTGINEITVTESNSGLNFSNPALNKSDDVRNFQYISKQLNESLQSKDIYVVPKDTPKEEFSYDKVKNTKIKVENTPNISEHLIKTIDNSRTMIDSFSKISTDKVYSTVISSSDGVLNTSRGIIGLTKIKSSEDKPKTILSSISNLAGGVGTLLMTAEIPEAEFLTLTAKIIGINLDSRDLRDNIKKNDSRGVVGTTVSISKGVWGAVVSGVNVTKAAVTLGATFELVSSETFSKVSNMAKKVSNINDKFQIPFAVIGTGLTFWDWRKAVNKANKKDQEITDLFTSTYNNTQLKGSGNQDIKYDELKTLKTNANYLALSFAASAISTTAIIASVAFPAYAIFTGPVSVACSILSSATGIMADDKIRELLKRK